MAVTVTELFETGGRTGEEYRNYSVTSDEPITYVGAREAVLDVAPVLVPIDSGGLLYIKRDDVEVYAVGELLWFARVSYSVFASDGFSFEIGGGTEHIRVNDRGPTFAYAPPGQTAPPTNGLIGIEADGTIVGCDVPPNSTDAQFERRKMFLDSEITSAYLATLVQMRRAVNSVPFYGLAAGEALFLGVRGQSMGDGSWELAFRWAGAPNRFNFSFPETNPVIHGINKEGWDYLWAWFEDDATPTALIKRPRAVYVERVLPRKDFSLLGIGTSL